MIEAVKPTGGPEEFYARKDDVFVAEDAMQTITLELDKRPSQAFRDEIKAKYPSGAAEPEMVAIPGGSFDMGCVSGMDCNNDEKPVHSVRIKPFEMSKTEITFEQWDACVAFGGCDYLPDDRGWGRGNRPVIKVSYDDIQKYIAWLNRQTGQHYRLPSEAEWEYAARAGTRSKYSWGNDIGRNKANCDGCGSQWDDKQTAPVASFAANGFGLHDMHGNVWEWVADCWNGSYAGAPSDGSAWEGGDCGRRVYRGGSWNIGPRFLRSASRDRDARDYRYDYLGFRLSRDTR